MVNPFENKHVIIGMSNHVFTNLYIDVLINRANVSENDLVFLTIDDEINHKLSDSINVKVLNYNKSDIHELIKAKSFTFISLTVYNSFLVKELYDCAHKVIDYIHIYLTDDEVDRWRKVKKRKGKLVEDEKAIIGACDLFMLTKIKSFITLDKAFRPALNDILERDDFNIVNVRDPFGTMPVEHIDALDNIFNMNTYHDKPERKIIIGSKQCFSTKVILKILKSFAKCGVLSDHKIVLFTSVKKRKIKILIELYAIYLKVIKKITLDISYSTSTNSLTYTSLMMSSSYFLLQSRGGISTARQYLSFGRGAICVHKGSYNDYELNHGLNVDTIRFENYDELSKEILNNNIDIMNNKKIMREEQMGYYNKLAALYSSITEER